MEWVCNSLPAKLVVSERRLYWFTHCGSVITILWFWQGTEENLAPVWLNSTVIEKKPKKTGSTGSMARHIFTIFT